MYWKPGRADRIERQVIGFRPVVPIGDRGHTEICQRRNPLPEDWSYREVLLRVTRRAPCLFPLSRFVVSVQRLPPFGRRPAYRAGRMEGRHVSDQDAPARQIFRSWVRPRNPWEPNSPLLLTRPKRDGGNRPFSA